MCRGSEVGMGGYSRSLDLTEHCRQYWPVEEKRLVQHIQGRICKAALTEYLWMATNGKE